jgi:tRNA(Arg) A34 adenosine deaminase TadA
MPASKTKMPNGKKFEPYMKVAIEEAKVSLYEGNHGFGSVIVLNGEVIAKSHDREVTLKDPTHHAELDSIRLASQKLNGNLTGCTIISTHEPCPMCASAIIWAGITEVVYGYSIKDSIKEGRKRINITSKELFQIAKARINVLEGVLKNDCSILYNKEVRNSIKQLRNIDSDRLNQLSQELLHKRKAWFIKNKNILVMKGKKDLDTAYGIFLKKLNICPIDAPIVRSYKNKIVIHSKNFCPTLEACKILNLDTRYICRNLNEEATDLLMKEVNPSLSFQRNYKKIRPYSAYCEEMICLDACINKK